MVTSPCAAKEAETPPVHGSARMLTKGRPAARSFAMTALVFAICMSESAPSCMRAPPELATTRRGMWSLRARSAASAIRQTTSPPTASLR